MIQERESGCGNTCVANRVDHASCVFRVKIKCKVNTQIELRNGLLHLHSNH